MITRIDYNNFSKRLFNLKKMMTRIDFNFRKVLLTWHLSLIWTKSFHVILNFHIFCSFIVRSIAIQLTYQVSRLRSSPWGHAWGSKGDTWEPLVPSGFAQKLLYTFFDTLRQIYINFKTFKTFLVWEKTLFKNPFSLLNLFID